MSEWCPDQAKGRGVRRYHHQRQASMPKLAFVDKGLRTDGNLLRSDGASCICPPCVGILGVQSRAGVEEYDDYKLHLASIHNVYKMPHTHIANPVFSL